MELRSFVFIAFHVFRSLVHFSSDLEVQRRGFFTDFMSIYVSCDKADFILIYALLCCFDLLKYF